MGYIILIGFCITAGYCLYKKKNYSVSIVILYMIISPCISLAGHKFDSSYIFVAFMFLIIAFRNKGKIPVFSSIKRYAAMLFVWMITYTIGWILNNRQSEFSFIINMTGLVKVLFLVYILVYCFSITKSPEETDMFFGKGILYALIANAATVFLQWIFPLQMFRICNDLYYSSDSSGYSSTETMDKWGGGFYKGHYYRFFGLFDTPMVFSCFCILVAAIVLVQLSTNKRFFKYPRVVLLISVVLGVSTQCKIYFFMIPILLVLYVLYNITHLSRRKFIEIGILAILAFLFVVFIDNIASISIFRFLNYLADPLSAFSTRFGTGKESGFLIDTVRVSFEYFLTGVGPISLSGEPLADCSYLIVLHNGGVFALIALVFYYVYLIILNNKTHKALNIITFALLFMGISRTILLASPLSLIPLAYFMSNGCILKEKRFTI